MSGWFTAFRQDGGPTLYGPMKTAVTADVLEAGFLFAIVILALSFIILIPAYRNKEMIYFIVKFVVSLFILASIMLCNFGQEWEVGHIHTRTPYRAGLRKEIEADIGVRIGLRSVNITLKTDPVVQQFDLENETINYNERFSWNSPGWTIGRVGFGPFASELNQEFRAAQLKGLPYPILWVAEYFTIDGEGIRWGRFYLQAGYFTHILLWLAFPLWILTLVLFKMVLHYGAYFCTMTGTVLLLANIVYAVVRNPFPLVIPFEDENIHLTWGWCFWLNLITGLLCLLLGCTVWFLELRYKEAVYSFFNIDIVQDIEEYYATMEELGQMGFQVEKPKRFTRKPDPRESGEYDNPPMDDADAQRQQLEYQRMFRPRRDTRGTLATRIRTITARPSSSNRPALDLNIDDGKVYENQAFAGREEDEGAANGLDVERRAHRSPTFALDNSESRGNRTSVI